MSYGVTENGFERPSFDEIRQEIIDEKRAIYGAINTGPESAIGQEIAIQAEREASLWDALEAIYTSQYPRSAAGYSLDGAVQFTGISRLDATKTVVSVDLTGDPGTVIPSGSEASTDDGDIFELVEDVTLDSEGEGSGQMQAVESGAVIALAGALTNIETPVSGWDSVDNPDDGQTGRAVETDAELRIRRQESLQVTGAGTVPAIRARLLQQVDNVTAVTIIENRSGEEDMDGRPPHSFEAVVSGGTDQDVADMLWEAKPAGIETTGEETVTVEDSEGAEHSISFSRPIQVYIWAKITVEENSEGVPDGATDAIKKELVKYGEGEFGVGDDVIYQALYGPIYNNVDGIKSVTIEIASSSDAESEPVSEDFESANIEIASNEVYAWLEDRIEVTII
jgi:uncharacterized phage protein gp47/JayE